MFSSLTLRSRLIALVLIALVPSLGLVVWLHGEFRRIQIEQLRRQVTVLAEVVAQGQSSRNAATRELLMSFASHAGIRAANVGECNAFFQRLLQHDPKGYANFGLVSVTGFTVCGAVPSQKPISIADRPHFKDAVTHRRFTVGSYAPGRIIGRPVVPMTLPVVDGDRLLGVVYASLEVQALSRSLATLKLPTGAVVTILDREGTPIARHPEKTFSVRHATPEELALMRQASPRLAEITNADGITRVFATVAVDPSGSMFAVAGLPTEPALAAATRQLGTMLALLFAAMVCVFGVAVFVSERQIRRPITRLLSATTRLGEGDRSARAGAIDGPPELRQLAASFDGMAELLEHRGLHAKQAQRLEAIGQLAGGVAHDFNNLLTVILGYGEELLDRLQGADRRDAAEIVAAANRAKSLTHQLLAFSRRQVLQPEPVQLNDTVAQLYAMLRRVIGEDIALVSKLGPELGIVCADPTQLEQVLLNLSVNARDAMPRGGLLTIETDNIEVGERETAPIPVGAEVVPPGAYVRLTVTDTGIGMDPETRARIFEPFFSTKGSQGTGLGLATVYGIVQQSGGFICCTSELGEGTTFYVYLPRVPDAAPPTPEAPPAPAPASDAREAILLVEDEDAVRTLTKHVLTQRGYEVFAAPSGREALRMLDAGLVIDLLLTDVVMPETDGHSLAQAVRARRPGLPVLYMSGYDGHAAVEATAVTFDVFLQKPFTPALLVEKVREALAVLPR